MLTIFGATTLLALAASTLRSPGSCRPGTLFTVRSDNPWHRASTLTIVGDLDGDGADEFVVASGAPSTLATLHSGRDGRTWDSRPAGRWPWSHADFARVRLVAGGPGDTLLDDWCGSWSPGVVGPLRLGRNGFTGFLVCDVGEVRAYTMCR